MSFAGEQHDMPPPSPIEQKGAPISILHDLVACKLCKRMKEEVNVYAENATDVKETKMEAPRPFGYPDDGRSRRGGARFRMMEVDSLSSLGVKSYVIDWLPMTISCVKTL